MVFTARMKFGFGSEEAAAAAHTALQTETAFKKKSESVLTRNGPELELEVSAKDFAPFRATVVSYLRLLKGVMVVKKMLQEDEL